MSEPIETLEISETLRVAAYLDYDASGPFDWDMVFVQTLRSAERLGALSSDDGQGPAILELMEHNPHTGGTYASGWSTTARDEWERDAITKHLTRAGFECRFIALRGQSQSEWHDAVIYAEAGHITEWGAFEREVKAWYAGEVYWLALERLETYRNENGNTITQWESVDTIGGIYLLDGLTRELAKEFFNLDAATVAA